MVKSLPLKSKMALAFHGEDSDGREGLKYGYKLLKGTAAELLNADFLTIFFRTSSPPSDIPDSLVRAFDESAGILATDVADASGPKFQELLRKKQRAWKKQLKTSSKDGGCHVAAADMRESFEEVALEAYSIVSIASLAASAWARQHELHRQSVKDEQKLSAMSGDGQAKTSLKYKFTNRQRAGDKKAGMMDEVYQMWDGDKAARGPRPGKPQTLVRG